MKLTDIMPLEAWVSLEREINETFGLNGVVYDTEGVRVTDFISWANPLCPAIKKTPEGQTQICALAHQNMATRAQRNGEPIVDECDAGMVKVVVPILVDGEFVGTCGGCGRAPDDSEVDTFYVGKVTAIPEEKVIELSRDVETLDPDRVAELARFLQKRVAEITA